MSEAFQRGYRIAEAAKYMGVSPWFVELKIRCEERAGLRMATLDVADSGPGIPETELENVFRPFYRVDTSRQQDTGGFGVGLAIADRAVRLHHGEVRARNRPEGGLIISLSLPCEK